MLDETYVKITSQLFIISQIILLSIAVACTILPFKYNYEEITGIKAIFELLLFAAVIFINIYFFKRNEWAYYIRHRFAYDSFNQKLFNIDNLWNVGAITDKEAEYRKAKVRFDIDYTASLLNCYYIGRVLNFFVIILFIISIILKIINKKEVVFFNLYNVSLACILLQDLIIIVFGNHDLGIILKGLKYFFSFPIRGVTLEKKELKDSKILRSVLPKKRTGERFNCKVLFGNLLTNKGDFLLCPLSNGFKPSNPLAHWVVKREGLKLENLLEYIEVSNFERSENTVFIPCKKLKYRGILFVCVDFYSEYREDLNVKRITESLLQAQRLNCSKLSCPVGFLYNEQEHSFRALFYALNKVIKEISCPVEKDNKLNYQIEFVIKRTLINYAWYGDYEWIFE